MAFSYFQKYNLIPDLPPDTTLKDIKEQDDKLFCAFDSQLETLRRDWKNILEISGMNLFVSDLKTSAGNYAFDKEEVEFIHDILDRYRNNDLWINVIRKMHKTDEGMANSDFNDVLSNFKKLDSYIKTCNFKNTSLQLFDF